VEGVQPADGDVQEVAGRAVDPLLAVEEPDCAGQDEEGFRDRSMKMGAWSGAVGGHVDSVQAELAAGGGARGEVVSALAATGAGYSGVSAR